VSASPSISVRPITQTRSYGDLILVTPSGSRPRKPGPTIANSPPPEAPVGVPMLRKFSVQGETSSKTKNRSSSFGMWITCGWWARLSQASE